MRIPPEKIEEIRNATDIVDHIGSFIPLKKRGKNFLGSCPFHQEKTPSFNVSPERQMYHCFGCGVGGNVITFVMEYEKVSFVEAVRSLAEKAGIKMPTYSSEDDARASEQEELYNVCKEAGLFYYKSLTETGEGKFAVEYFHKRGFTDDTIRSFGLGYSPNSWEALIDYAKGRKFSFELLEKAGLVRKRDDGTYHDYFRGRVMFPIFSTTGRVLGFGARKLLEDDPLGKYINSPETLIYNKSRILYGLYQSKDEIRDKDFAILVEGYADLISVYQAGIKNVVASSGTALTHEQIQLISRYTKNITLMYDADSAGSKAALRGVDLILENDLDVRVATLSEGEDPDSFVRKKGKDAFVKLLDGSVSFIDFIAQEFQKQGKLTTPEGQAQTVRAIVQTIAKMKDELKRNLYIKQVAEKYRLYESTLFRELEKIIGDKSRYSKDRFVQSIPAIGEEDVNVPERTALDIPTVERDLIHAMLEGGMDVIKMVSQHITLDDFTHPQSKALVEILFNHLEEGQPFDSSALINEIEDQSYQKLIAEVIFSKHQISKEATADGRFQPANPLRIAIDSILKIKELAGKRILEEIRRQQKDAALQGEDTSPYGVHAEQLRTQISNEIETLKKQLKG